MFKSKSQPLCRYCGKAISRLTSAVSFGEGRFNNAFPRNKGEARQYLDQQIVTVHYGGWHEGRPYIASCSIWDGKTYRDEFFCGDPHARALGYLQARQGATSVAYTEAKAKRLAKEREA